MNLIEQIGFKPKIINVGLEAFLEKEIYTYAGGLGILEGDKIRTAADMALPILYVILDSSKGYGKQVLDSNGWQTTEHGKWNPEDHCKKLNGGFKIPVASRDIHFGYWLYDKPLTKSGKNSSVVLITSFVEGNTATDKSITSNLYGSTWGKEERPWVDLMQRTALGVGSVVLAEKLGVLNNVLFHMNEGHAVFSALEMLKRNDWDEKKTKKQFVFTTHTPVDAGIDKFDYSLLSHNIRHMFPDDLEQFKNIGGGLHNSLNAAELALNLSKKANAVSLLHSKVANDMFGYVKNRDAFPIIPIVNGVHSTTWTSDNFAKIYDRHVPDWREDPTKLRYMKLIDNSTLVDIWDAHQQNKRELIRYVKKYVLERHLNVNFDYDSFTIGFARRAVTYKQAEFIFSDIERLKNIAKKDKLQLVFAGNAHDADHPAKEMIQRIYERSKWLKADNISVIYLEKYNADLAKILVAGSDLWLATSEVPKEASGTSGMKAAHNGVPSLSVKDGWWYESNQSIRTGWDIINANDMYNTLEDHILPLYHGKNGFTKGMYAGVMNNAIAHNASHFNTHRMMKDYFDKLYGIKMEDVLIR